MYVCSVALTRAWVYHFFFLIVLHFLPPCFVCFKLALFVSLRSYGRLKTTSASFRVRLKFFESINIVCVCMCVYVFVYNCESLCLVFKVFPSLMHHLLSFCACARSCLKDELLPAFLILNRETTGVASVLTLDSNEMGFNFLLHTHCCYYYFFFYHRRFLSSRKQKRRGKRKF